MITLSFPIAKSSFEELTGFGGPKQNQTITFTALSAKTFGDPTFALSATSSSGLTVNYASSNTAVATVSGNTVTIVGAGSSTITASQSGNINFNAAPDVTQTLTVSKASQSITFSALSDKTVSDAPFSLAATASSGLSVSYSTTSSKLTISANQVTLINAGRATITASQAGNTNYNPAPSVDQSFCINPATPTVRKGPYGETVTLTAIIS